MPSGPGFSVNGVDQSPPKLGGVPARSAGWGGLFKVRAKFAPHRYPRSAPY